MHFLGIKWNNESFKPSIQYREEPHLEGKVLLRDLNVGESIYFGIKPERYCIGYFGHPDYTPVPCPHTSMLSGDATRVQCAECQTHDSALFLPLGSLSTTQRVLVKSQPHYNYINLFGSDLLKVGVAAGVRRYTRIHEQGAHATLFITACDGIIAREIEDVISNTLHIKQRVNATTKLENIYQYIESEKAQKKLMDMYKQVQYALSHMYARYLIPEPEYLYNMSYYNINQRQSEVFYIVLPDI